MMSFLNTIRMDGLSQRENRYLSFSNRVALGNVAHYRIPSQEDVQRHDDMDNFDNYISNSQPHDDIDSFGNDIPSGERKAGNKRLKRLTQHPFDGASGNFENEIPDDQQEPSNRLITGVDQREFDTASGSSRTSLRGRSRLSALIWLAMIVTL